MLCKIRVNDSIPVLKDIILHPSIKLVMDKYFIPNSIYFTNGEIILNNISKYDYHITYKKNKKEVIEILKHDRIIFNYDGKQIWKSIDSFHQNNCIISQSIHQCVIDSLDNITDQLIGIGGEFMTYFALTNNKYNSYIGMSNSFAIIDDAKYNQSIYNLPLNLYMINYRKLVEYPPINTSSTIIIQVSKITNILIEYLLINQKNIKKIVVINCHKKDYDKKITPLTKYFKLDKINVFNNIYIYSWHKNDLKT